MPLGFSCNKDNVVAIFSRWIFLLGIFSMSGCSYAIDFVDNIVRITPELSNPKLNKSEQLTTPPEIIAPSYSASVDEFKNVDEKTINPFSENILDDQKRILRLEGVVKNLNQEINSHIPSIKRLVKIETELKQLILQLDSLVSEEKQNLSTLPVTEVVEPAEDQNSPTNILAPVPKTTSSASVVQPQPKLAENPQEPATPQQSQPVLKGDPALDPNIKYIDPAPKKESASNLQIESRTTPDAQIDGVAVKEFRFGHYPDKSRLVFDLTAPSRYRVDIDEIEKLMVVEFEEAKWLAPKTASYTKNPILKKYEVQDNGEGGVLIVFELRHEAQIAKELMLDALKGGGKRLFFDLKSPAIHR